MDKVDPAPAHTLMSDAEVAELRQAFKTLERYTIVPRIPMPGPPTGHEGEFMKSLPGHRMFYNEEPGMEGVEIETPEGMRIAFYNSRALERFLCEMNVSSSDRDALAALDARSTCLRQSHPPSNMRPCPWSQ